MPNEEQLAGIIERVSRAEEAVKTAKAELKTAERAGIDVQAPQTRLNELSAKLKRVKTAYNI